MSETPWMTVAEAAVYARVSEDWVRERINDGRLRPARLSKGSSTRGRREDRIHRDDMDALLRSYQVGGAVPDGADEPTPRRKGATAAPGTDAIKARFRRAKV